MSNFLNINCDLHLHGLYSGAVSDRMIPKIIGEQAPLKGINLMGTGDILNNRWIKLVKEQLKKSDGNLLEHENGTKFILQTEVEDSNRVHHIILIPEFSIVEELREKFKNNCKNLDSDGRPKIWMNGEEIAEICIKNNCLIGFAHAFTPYFSLYSKFNSYKDCYGKYWKDIHFLELGLSADTNMADNISELHNLTFTTNSDAHSPWPNKIGREFNVFQVKDISFNEIEKALKREDNRKCILNVGFNPLEGKYNKTRCTGCLNFYNPEEAIKLKWKCSCGKSIKKGADYRVHELSSTSVEKHPSHRPEYKHIIPLSEIIALYMGIKDSWSVKVQERYKQIINKFGNEIKILLEIDYFELRKFDETLAEYIKYFREDKIKYIPGGAGVYGKLINPGSEKIIERVFESKADIRKQQSSLSDF